jgi:hypothetical protein
MYVGAFILLFLLVAYTVSYIYPHNKYFFYKDRKENFAASTENGADWAININPNKTRNIRPEKAERIHYPTNPAINIEPSYYMNKLYAKYLTRNKGSKFTAHYSCRNTPGDWMADCGVPGMPAGFLEMRQLRQAAKYTI